MKFCTHCGTSLPDRAEICPVCKSKCSVTDAKPASESAEAAAKSELKENQKISEAKAKAEAEKKAKAEAHAKAEAEKKAKAEARAKAESEKKAELEAARKAKEEAAAKAKAESLSKIAEKPESAAAEKTENPIKTEEPKKAEKTIKSTDSRTLLVRLSVIFAVIAALVSAVFVMFLGVSVKITVPPRDVDPEVFYYFVEHGFSYFVKSLDAAKATELITETGFYPTEQLVNAYVTLSVIRSIVVIASVVLIAVFTLIAVIDFLRYAKNGDSKFRPVWAISAVVTYVCCVVAVRMFDYGKIEFVFRSGNKTISSSELSMDLNAPTIIGLCLSLLLLAAALVTDYLSGKNGSERAEQKSSSVGLGDGAGYSRKTEESKNRKTFGLGKVAVYCVAGLSLLTIFVSGFTAVSSTSKGFGEMEVKDPQTGEYQTMSGAREYTETMPLTSLLRKYSLEEEETLYEIGNVEKLLARYPDNLDWIIEKEGLDAKLASIRERENYAFNFGMSMAFTDLATIVFSGLLAVYVLCLREKLHGELLVVVSLLPMIFSFVSFAVGIFLLRSFGKIQVELGIAAPFLTILTSAAACVLTFFVRKAILKKSESEHQVLD